MPYTTPDEIKHLIEHVPTPDEIKAQISAAYYPEIKSYKVESVELQDPVEGEPLKMAFIVSPIDPTP